MHCTAGIRPAPTEAACARPPCGAPPRERRHGGGQARRARRAPGRCGALSALGGRAVRSRTPRRLLAAVLAGRACVAEIEGQVEVPQELADKYQRLAEWVQAGQDAWDFGDRRPAPLARTLRLGLGRFGRSLLAGQSFAEGDTITLIPLTRLIYDQEYGVGLDGLQPNQQAAVWLARQRQLGEASDYPAYTAMLPERHDDLPKYWDDDFLFEHTQGSGFPSYVRSMRDELKTEWEQVHAVTGLSWEEFEVAHDNFQTRSVYWNSSWVKDDAPRARRSSALIPLFDLLIHGSESNADYKFDVELQAMRLYAKRPIREGEEILIPYWEPPGSRTNTEVLNKWGFATDDALKMAEVKVLGLTASPPPEGQPSRPSIPGAAEEAPDPYGGDVPSYALEQTAFDGAATAFLAHLRAMADSTAFHLEDGETLLPEGWLAIPDAKTGWMYYWQSSTGEVTFERPGHPNGAEKPFFTPVRTWGIEVAALTMARRLFVEHLETYPQTVSDDEALLAGDIPDVRVRFLVLIRRNEKQVLSWWLELIDRALAGAPDDPEALVDKSLAHLNHFLWNLRAEL